MVQMNAIRHRYKIALGCLLTQQNNATSRFLQNKPFIHVPADLLLLNKLAPLLQGVFITGSHMKEKCLIIHEIGHSHK